MSTAADAPLVRLHALQPDIRPAATTLRGNAWPRVLAFRREPHAVSCPPADGRHERAARTAANDLHRLPKFRFRGVPTKCFAKEDLANTLEPELVLDLERLAQPMGLHLLRNAGLSCICIRLYVRPNV